MWWQWHIRLGTFECFSPSTSYSLGHCLLFQELCKELGLLMFTSVKKNGVHEFKITAMLLLDREWSDESL